MAFGPVVEVMSGITNMLGYGPDELRNSAMALVDPIGGTHAVAAIAMALQERKTAAKGSGLSFLCMDAVCILAVPGW